MSRLLQIQEQLLDASGRISRIERALTEHPSRALTSSLKSLYKLRSGLQEEFKLVTADAQVDVIGYRLFEGKATMSLVGKALDSFQTLYAIMYAAIEAKRAKDTSHLSLSAIEKSAFDFSYAYGGSVAFVFTMPNDRLLFGETKLDQAMVDLFSLARAESTDQIKLFALRFGLAPIRAIHKWASALCAAGSGVELDWRKAASGQRHLLLQPAEVEALKNLIDLTSDLEIVEFDVRGTLLGFDSRSGSFRFEPDDGSMVLRGSVSDVANIPARVSIPQTYIAQIKTTTRVRYATEEPEIKHELLSLTPIRKSPGQAEPPDSSENQQSAS